MGWLLEDRMPGRRKRLGAALVAVLSLAVSPMARSAAAQATGTPATGAAPAFPLPPGVQWGPNPMIPPGGQLAVLVGALPAKGPYAARIGFSADLKVPPHTPPEDRIYTVLSGTWLIGIGPVFDPSRLERYPTGAVYLLPANTPHFHWAREGATVVQINGVGPSATVYVNPEDDPRTPAR